MKTVNTTKVKTVNITKVEYVLQTNILENGKSISFTTWDRSEDMQSLTDNFKSKVSMYKNLVGQPTEEYDHSATWVSGDKEMILFLSEEWTKEV